MFHPQRLAGSIARPMLTRVRPAVITLPLEIDVANARYAGEQLAAACVPGAVTLIADLTLTRFCDTTGALMLAEVQRYAAHHGTELRLAVPGTAVRRVLAEVGRSLRIYPTLDDALAGVSTPPAPAGKALPGSGAAPRVSVDLDRE